MFEVRTVKLECMVTLYNTVSADGYIARNDGGEDFIPDEAWDDFLEILRGYEVVILGRKSYETIQSYPELMVEAFEKMLIRRVVVSRDPNIQLKSGYSAISSVSEISKLGNNILLTSGPTLNTAALDAGIIDQVVLNTLPEKIGEGLLVFHHSPKLLLRSARELPNGRKLCTYSVDSKG